jgi:predicted  nucleic acid-binding Zn-ribbon protein
MNLDTISRKQLNDLEQQVKQLLGTIHRAKLENIPLVEALQQLEHELEEARRAQFDSINSEFHTY